jgi:sec-independent protein translocase protein TatA
MGLGWQHFLLFALILLLLFGRGRISDLMGDIGKGLKSFKQGLNEDEKAAEQQKQIPPQQPIDVTPRPSEPTATPPASGDDQSRS